MTGAPHYADETVALHHGDCLDVLRSLPDASVDAVVTDPPYNLGFMGKEWDRAGGMARATSTSVEKAANPYGRARAEYGGASYGGSQVESMRHFQSWCELWAAECLRVLKPGGHMLAFGGTRTWHRLAVAAEDAGFEIRDSIAWMYGSGFPKSLDVSKAIDSAAGAVREIVGPDPNWRARVHGDATYDGGQARPQHITAPATEDARTWQGWGTALKPAFEPIVVARKPLVGTVAANVLAHGTGVLNVDGCRIGDEERVNSPSGAPGANNYRLQGGDGRDVDNARRYAEASKALPPTTVSGRWPANVVLDESQAAALDEQSGKLASGRLDRAGITAENGIYGRAPAERTGVYEADAGGASRFFYVAKAGASERVRVNGTAHPTVKPLALMRWLIRLVTPPGGTVLEPFAGSGTTVEACILEGFRCIAIEREADYLPLIVQRINRRRDPVAAVKATGDDGGLFDLLDEESA